MADLMTRLAYNWGQVGEWNRAAQMARQANVLLEGIGEDQLQRISALRAWAVSEMERGNLRHAAEIAQQRIELARRWRTRAGDSGLLIDALELSAMILSRLGLADDERAVQRELDVLKSKNGSKLK